MAGTGFTRDPVSVLWDRTAPVVLYRAYERRGGWYATRIPDPQPAHLLYFRDVWGIDVTGPDNAATISGRHINYRTRWNRSFVRALNYGNDGRHGGPGGSLEIQVGVPKPASPGAPAGWSVRLRVRRGGERRARRAVERKKDGDRIWLDGGDRGGRFHDVNGRDW